MADGINFHIASYTASYGTAKQLPESVRPEVVFAGRSNVGKSSLLNKLMFRKGLAKVSSKPGKTATINFYLVGADKTTASTSAAVSTGGTVPLVETAPPAEEAGVDAAGKQTAGEEPTHGKIPSNTPSNTLAAIDLVDLPGYGYAQVSKAERERWANLIDGYFEMDRDIALVVSLIDIRHDPSALDREMVAFLQESGLPYAIALTKADKLSKQKSSQQRARIRKVLDLPKDVPMLVTSAETGTGMDELRELISEAREMV